MRRDLRAEAKLFLRRAAGRDPLEDIRAFLDAVPRPVVFDVGANVGQSVAAHAIDRIDLLKIDTQGYELEVRRGAARMSTAGRIGLVYMEVIFSDMYEELPPFDALYRFLLDSGFRLVALYNFQMPNQTASWCDALFAQRRC